jgi:hypothetical protein
MLETINALNDKVWSLFHYQTLLCNYQYSVIHHSIQVSRKKKRKRKVDLYQDLYEIIPIVPLDYIYIPFLYDQASMLIY